MPPTQSEQGIEWRHGTMQCTRILNWWIFKPHRYGKRLGEVTKFEWLKSFLFSISFCCKKGTLFLVDKFVLNFFSLTEHSYCIDFICMFFTCFIFSQWPFFKKNSSRGTGTSGKSYKFTLSRVICSCPLF